MAEIATIARPYADALFATVGTGAAAEAVQAGGLADQLDLLGRVATDAQVKALADDPRAKTDQVVGLIEQVMGAGGASMAQPLRNLLQLLVTNRRLAALPAVATQFRAQANAARGVADAVITSAFPMDDAQLADLTRSLEARFKRSLKARVEVDPSLIGGVRVAVGDEVLDTSVKARLDQMRAALTA